MIRITRLPQFRRMWKKLPESVQSRASIALDKLIKDRSHPSLRLKRYKRSPEYWEVRVDKNHRIICGLEKDWIILVAIGPHNMLDRFRVK